jgi:hypothetical protein
MPNPKSMVSMKKQSLVNRYLPHLKFDDQPPYRNSQ